MPGPELPRPPLRPRRAMRAVAFVLALLLAGVAPAAAQESGDGPSPLDQLIAVAESGDPDAMVRLARLYGRGYEGLAPDKGQMVAWYRRAAEAGHVLAALYLGFALKSGEAGTPEPAEALKWLERAGRDRGDPAVAGAAYEAARMYVGGIGTAPDGRKAKELYGIALAKYEALANDGNADAAYRLGQMHQEGLGTKADDDRARHWYGKAAAAYAADPDLKPSRMARLAGLHEKGLGVPKDPKKAIAIYQAAIDQGDFGGVFGLALAYLDPLSPVANPVRGAELLEQAYREGGVRNAAYRLGVIHFAGQGINQDYIKAREWFELAAQDGDVNAMSFIGTLYLRGWGVEQSEEKAVEWFGRAAENGNPDAMFQLAKLTEDGKLPETEPGSVARWYRQASLGWQVLAEAGNLVAAEKVGDMFRDGRGVDRDPEEAGRWYKLALERRQQLAEKGERDSMYWLAGLYRDGSGVDEDRETAVFWYRKCADRGHLACMYNLGIHYLQGLGVDKDYEQARRWLERAAERGEASSQFQLGLIFSRGLGVKTNPILALKWIELAAEQGIDAAKTAMAQLTGAMIPEERSLSKRLARTQKQQTRRILEADRRKIALEGGGEAPDLPPSFADRVEALPSASHTPKVFTSLEEVMRATARE